MTWTTGNWLRTCPAEWIDGDTAYLSIAFTWHLPAAYSKAIWYRSQGFKVRAGGPGVFTQMKYLAGVAEIGGSIPDAVSRHNPMATYASRGCDVGCWHCIVPKMDGKVYTLIPDFPVRPVLCDNNLSGLSAKYQDHIVGRYKAEGVPLLDANSGFAPDTFDDEVYARWNEINQGPWRFAYDDQGDGADVERVMNMLRDVSEKRKRVYVLIGNEPVASCLDRINRVIGWGGDPHVQPFIKLNALEKKPHVRHDWTAGKLREVARWCNSWAWKKCRFEDFDPGRRTQFVDPNQPNLEAAQ